MVNSSILSLHVFVSTTSTIHIRMAQRLSQLSALVRSAQLNHSPLLPWSASSNTAINIWPYNIRSAILPLASFPIVPRLPSIISDIWDSVLRAVPKKKTSHSKSRSRRLAGKALKDVTNLAKCSSCGRIKRAFVLCPYCVQCMCGKKFWPFRY